MIFKQEMSRSQTKSYLESTVGFMKPLPSGLWPVTMLQPIAVVYITQKAFLKLSWRTHSRVLVWGHWYPCFGFLMMSPLGFKARVGSALFVIPESNVMYIP